MQYVDLPSTLKKKNGVESVPVKGEHAVKNSIQNILSTVKGTVPGHPEFGSGIDKFLFEQLDPFTTVMIEEEIRYALKRWEPRVDIVEVKIKSDPDYNRIVINIIYKIKTDVESNSYEYIYKQELV